MRAYALRVTANDTSVKLIVGFRSLRSLPTEPGSCAPALLTVNSACQNNAHAPLAHIYEG